MTSHVNNKKRAKRGHRSRPKAENASNKPFKKVVKNVIGQVSFLSKDAKQKGSKRKKVIDLNSKRTRRICTGLFILAVLVIVFVGSSVRFFKCKSGF